MTHNATYIVGIIPARYASSRLPGKPLAQIGGKVMVQRVYEQALKARALREAVVATDDERILHAVESFGGRAVMTSPDCPSGADRCVETARFFPQATHFVNIQGDEPFIRPEQIDLLINTLCADTRPKAIATLCKKIASPELLFSPHVVKVVRGAHGDALYFSRSAIPHLRDHEPATWLQHADYYQHIGLYGFTREALETVGSLRPSALERAESLEQLRWLENGLAIAVAETPWETLSVDTPEDLLRAQQAV